MEYHKTGYNFETTLYKTFKQNASELNVLPDVNIDVNIYKFAKLQM